MNIRKLLRASATAVMLAVTSLCFAQPPQFTLSVSKTDETCLANGTLTFSVSGTDPAAAVEYSIYLLPDTLNAIAVQTNTFLGGRTSGTYRVVAKQTLNGVSNFQTAEATIINQIVQLTYGISSTHSLCGNDATITVSVNTGTGVQYEIISGPVTRPLQNSAVFTQLPAGVYDVRVFDNCGQGWVTTHTVISDAPTIDIGPVEFPQKELSDCSEIVVANTLLPSPGSTLTYPMTAVFTVFPPGGGNPFTVTKLIASGDPNSGSAQALIPFYYDQPYTYNLSVTDHCGNVFTENDILIHQRLSVGLVPSPAECGQFFLTAVASIYKPPLQITFLSAPGGFSPEDFNALHPGPFADGTVYYGSSNDPVPFGTYTIQINDSCGHSAQTSVTLIDEPAHPTATIEPYAGCLSNTSLVKVEIPGFTIVTAIITAAPAAYPNLLPDDVSVLVTIDDGLALEHLPAGNYTAHLIDECGTAYDYDFIVPGLATSATVSTRNDCNDGKGGVRIRGNSTALTSAVMTGAPATFTTALPFFVSSYLSADGILSIGELPAGIYEFKVTDSCGMEHILSATVPGYHVNSDDFALTPHCGSFDMQLSHSSNGAGGETFWLQKYYPATGVWGHPDTGVAYIDGTAPTAANSFAVSNNVNMLNLVFTGQFRIVKRFETFGNGNDELLRNCIEVLREFEFTGAFEITGFEKVSCNTQYSDIKILTNGVPPMTYWIESKNGQPFYVNNGTNNVFTGLETATYVFKVQHSCGHIATRPVDITQLPALVEANQPPDIEICDDLNDGVETVNLLQQNQYIMGTQNPANYTISYHLSAADAATGNNAIPFTYTSGSAEIFAKLQYNANPNCFDVVSFSLIVNPLPIPDISNLWNICQNGTLTITAPPGYIYYQWHDGTNTYSGQTHTFSQPGQYSLTVADANCEGTFPFTIELSLTAAIRDIEISDWTDADNTITVLTDGANIDDYLYSLDNIHFQESNVFTGLSAGFYTVYVKDRGECGLAHDDVVLLTYPKYFTPNGDGTHDHWKIKFSESEPHLRTFIYDRYGKLITGFMPNSDGWDGTLNGEPLPSTDYWFVVVREDGKTFRGHFAMKR